MSAKQQIIKAIENCDDEQLKNRMYVRVARRYCVANRVTNIVNDDGSAVRPTLPSVEEMVKALDDEKCYQILTSHAFSQYREIYGENMKCCECWECTGLDCPVISQMEADDIAAYKQMEATASIEDGDMNRYLLVKGENIFGEEVEDVLDEEEDLGYMGDPGFSSSDDYWSYILG